MINNGRNSNAMGFFSGSQKASFVTETTMAKVAAPDASIAFPGRTRYMKKI